MGEKHGVAWSFLNQGDIAWFEGHYDEAEDLYKQSLKGHEEVHDVQGAAWARGSLGHVMLYKGDYKQAALYLNKCLETSRKLADRLGIYGCLIGIAELLRRVGKLEQATCLLGATQALCKDFSKNQILQLRPTITDYATIKDELLRQYGEVLFGEAEGEGRAMSLNGALKYAQTQTAKTCWINPHSTPT